jgi:hypothetical protein
MSPLVKIPREDTTIPLPGLPKPYPFVHIGRSEIAMKDSKHEAEKGHYYKGR